MTLYFEYSCEEEADFRPFDFDAEATARLVAETALTMEGCPYEAEVSVTVVSDGEIRDINARTRGIDAATDVLSFPVTEYSEPSKFSEADEQEADAFDMESGNLLLGDIVISADRVRAQAEEYGHSERREFAFLVAHSMLHLMGYDHMEEDEEKLMFDRQEEILQAAGIPR